MKKIVLISLVSVAAGVGIWFVYRKIKQNSEVSQDILNPTSAPTGSAATNIQAGRPMTLAEQKEAIRQATIVTGGRGH